MAKYRVCPRCRGEGKVVHAACSTWTADDRMEDPEGFEEMLKGTYDVTCPECCGNRVVTKKDSSRYATRRNEARIRAMESGDPEMYYNPDLGLM